MIFNNRSVWRSSWVITMNCVYMTEMTSKFNSKESRILNNKYHVSTHSINTPIYGTHLWGETEMDIILKYYWISFMFSVRILYYWDENKNLCDLLRLQISLHKLTFLLHRRFQYFQKGFLSHTSVSSTLPQIYLLHFLPAFYRVKYNYQTILS